MSAEGHCSVMPQVLVAVAGFHLPVVIFAFESRRPDKSIVVAYYISCQIPVLYFAYTL